jgi:hypothetical protein
MVLHLRETGASTVPCGRFHVHVHVPEEGTAETLAVLA